MRTILATLLALPVATAVHAAGELPTRYVDLVNRSHDSVVALEIATAGSEAYASEALGGRLRGGGGSTTIAIRGDDCVYDLRFTFRDGRTLVERGVDVCRSSGLRIERLPHVDESRPMLAASLDP